MGTTYYAVNVARHEAIDLDKGPWSQWNDDEAQSLDLEARLRYVWSERPGIIDAPALAAMLRPHEPFIVVDDNTAFDCYEGFEIIIDRYGNAPDTLNDGHLL